MEKELNDIITDRLIKALQEYCKVNKMDYEAFDLLHNLVKEKVANRK